MAAPVCKNEEVKDKSKSMQYGQKFQPDEEVFKLYIDAILACHNYHTEYRECKRMRSRVNQYFVFGQKWDCEHLKAAYEACQLYKEGGNQQARDYIVTYEKAKNDYRMGNAQANDVWEYRTTPLKEWNLPVNTVPKDEITPEADLQHDVPKAEIAPEADPRLLVDVQSMKTNNPGNSYENSYSLGNKTENFDDQSNYSADISKGGNSDKNKKGWCAVS